MAIRLLWRLNIKRRNATPDKRDPVAPVRPAGLIRQCGTSLIEQIMVLVIVASLAGMATAPLRHLLIHNQLRSARDDLLGAMQNARASAITSGRPALLCPSADGVHCSPGLRWEGGWLLAHDADGDGQPDGAPVYGGRGYAGQLVIQSSSRRRQLRFHPDGSASGSNVTLLFCSPGSPDAALSVVLANSGRARSSPATPNQVATCAQLR